MRSIMDGATGKSVGVVINIQGQAQAVSSSGTRELSNGSELFQGEKLVTLENGQIEIKFIDNTTLSLGRNSEVTIDAYVYDPENGSNSNLLLEMGKGVFRTVTGEIAKQNPDKFNIKSPLAFIGIRGTIVVGEVTLDTEKWGAEDIGKGHVLVVRDLFGNIQFINVPKQIFDLFQGQPIQPARPLTLEEQTYFKDNAPITVTDNPAPDDKSLDSDEPEG